MSTSPIRQLIADISTRRDLCLAATSYAQVTRSVGLLIEAEGLHAGLGNICWLIKAHDEVPCEVVGFSDDRTFLMPLAHTDGIEPGGLIRVPAGTGAPDEIPEPTSRAGR